MKTKISALLLIAMFCLPCFLAWADRPDNELPMYGGKHNPEIEQNKKFSKSAADLGWQYYQRGDLDTAMKRFNQAWMFDRNSADALWGFGLIMGHRAYEELPEHHFKESIRFLGMAVEKAPRDVRILVDLAFSHTLLGEYLMQGGKSGFRDEFATADRLYEAAERLDPKYPLLHLNWSVLEFDKGDYFKAKERLDDAISLGARPNPEYERELEKKLTK